MLVLNRGGWHYPTGCGACGAELLLEESDLRFRDSALLDLPLPASQAEFFCLCTCCGHRIPVHHSAIPEPVQDRTEAALYRCLGASFRASELGRWRRAVGQASQTFSQSLPSQPMLPAPVRVVETEAPAPEIVPAG